jgi:O-antigen/teichoic acid export membrane protein
VGPLAIPLIIATAVRGVTTLYNTFMSAHARGRDVRNAALILVVSNLLFNFALIPPLGATGAAWASLFALLVNYVGYLSYYRRYVRGSVAAT